MKNLVGNDLDPKQLLDIILANLIEKQYIHAQCLIAFTISK